MREPALLGKVIVNRIFVYLAVAILCGCGDKEEAPASVPTLAREGPTEVEMVAAMEAHYTTAILAHDALIEGGRLRLRPVLMTAVTTILGLVPLTTGVSVNFKGMFQGDFDRILILGGDSSAWWGPMGTAVIWGLTVATFLTLVVVPVMYASVDGTKRFFANLFWHWPTRPFRRA